MDGAQGSVKQSLQFKLSAWLSIIVLIVALGAGWFSYMTAYSDAIEAQDDQLRQIAALIKRHRLYTNMNSLLAINADASGTASDDPEADPDARIVVQMLWQHPPQQASNSALANLPADLVDGVQTVQFQQRSWRLFVRTLAPGVRVAVGQQTEEREEIAHDSALRTVLPLLLLAPILLLLVADIIRKVFQPLRDLAQAIDQRAEHDFTAMTDDNLPSEIRPFVVAINRLLLRVAQAANLQRRFVADAAHELRTPLTALSLQAEALEVANLSADDRRQRLASLRQGMQRTRQLLDQLLTLARVQDVELMPTAAVAIMPVLQHLLEDLMPLALAHNIDLGVVDAVDAVINAQQIDVHILLKNLLDNALRYTPEGGRIDIQLRVQPGQLVVQVLDTGPGIPPAEQQRVFDAFYRGLGHDQIGSGLGLSIVQTIATRIGAQVSLRYANEQTQSGLCAQVIFSTAGMPL